MFCVQYAYACKQTHKYFYATQYIQTARPYECAKTIAFDVFSTHTCIHIHFHIDAGTNGISWCFDACMCTHNTFATQQQQQWREQRKLRL